MFNQLCLLFNFGIETIDIKLVWIIILVISVIVEALSPALLSVWFALGSAVAAVLAYIGFSPEIQSLSFFAVSLTTLIFGKPIVRKFLFSNKPPTKTNVYSFIGEEALVKKSIKKFEHGQVLVNGQTWTASSENQDLEFKEGAQVTIIGVEGVRLLVEPVKKEDSCQNKQQDYWF